MMQNLLVGSDAVAAHVDNVFVGALAGFVGRSAAARGGYRSTHVISTYIHITIKWTTLFTEGYRYLRGVGVEHSCWGGGNGHLDLYAIGVDHHHTVVVGGAAMTTWEEEKEQERIKIRIGVLVWDYYHHIITSSSHHIIASHHNTSSHHITSHHSVPLVPSPSSSRPPEVSSISTSSSSSSSNDSADRLSFIG